MKRANHPTFTWLGHAALKFELPSGEVAVIDPFLTGNPSAPARADRFERLDLILVTHAHGDHVADVVRLAREHDALVVGQYDLCQWFESQGVKRTSGMNLGGTQQALGLRISQVRADHSSSFEHEGRIVYGGVATGYVVKLEGGYTFYHSGDTALFSDMSLIGELHRPDLAFLPIGDHFTMDPYQAARACRLLNVHRVVPIHWGTFPLLTGRPETLIAQLRDHGCATEVVVLEPGEPWTPED
jgi:L-ascorbate metabolism protein UlaG (beta-lactamase superfamily)